MGPGSQDLTGNGTTISEMNYSAAALQLTFLLGQLNISPQTFAEEEACALTGLYYRLYPNRARPNLR